MTRLKPGELVWLIERLLFDPHLRRLAGVLIRDPGTVSEAQAGLVVTNGLPSANTR